MAKRKSKPIEAEEQPVPPAVKPKPKPTTDRHKDNQSVRLSGKHYRALKKLAERNRRPLRWELLVALENHLREAGLWDESTTSG